MAVARVWNGSDWIPVAGGSGLDVPSNIASGYGVVYNGNGQWVPQRLATEQALDDLRDEFEGDTRFLNRPATGAPSDGCVITSDVSQQGGAKWQPPLHCVAYDDSTTVVSVTPASTWVTVPMDSEVLDVGSLHSTSSNTDRINLSRAGVWEVGYQHLFLASTGYSNGYVASRMLINGTGHGIGYCRVETWSGGKEQQQTTHGAGLAISDGDDYITSQAIYVGGTTSIVGASGEKGYTSMWARYLGPSA